MTAPAGPESAATLVEVSRNVEATKRRLDELLARASRPATPWAIQLALTIRCHQEFLGQLGTLLVQASKGDSL